MSPCFSAGEVADRSFRIAESSSVTTRRRSDGHARRSKARQHPINLSLEVSYEVGQPLRLTPSLAHFELLHYCKLRMFAFPLSDGVLKLDIALSTTSVSSRSDKLRAETNKVCEILNRSGQCRLASVKAATARSFRIAALLQAPHARIAADRFTHIRHRRVHNMNVKQV